MVRTVYTQNVLYNKNNIDYYDTVVLGRTWGFLKKLLVEEQLGVEKRTLN